jgi:hypothetical protein
MVSPLGSAGLNVPLAMTLEQTLKLLGLVVAQDSDNSLDKLAVNSEWFMDDGMCLLLLYRRRGPPSNSTRQSGQGILVPSPVEGQ